MNDKEKYFDTCKLLDEALKTDPQFELPSNFADVLADKMSRKFAWQQYFNEFLIYLAVIFGLVAVSAAIQFVWFGADWQRWMQFFIGNISIILGVNILVVFVLFADRVLLRYFMHKSDFI
jgi:uncharacterized membrane protein